MVTFDDPHVPYHWQCAKYRLVSLAESTEGASRWRHLSAGFSSCGWKGRQSHTHTAVTRRGPGTVVNRLYDHVTSAGRRRDTAGLLHCGDELECYFRFSCTYSTFVLWFLWHVYIFFVCFRMFHCLFAVALFASTKLSFSFCPVNTGIGDRCWVFYPVFIKATQPGHPLKSGTMSTGDRFRHRWGKNGEFCVEVGPVTRTAGILAYCTCWLNWV